MARGRCLGRMRWMLRRRLKAVVEPTALCCWVCSEGERGSRDHDMISRLGGGRRELLLLAITAAEAAGRITVFVVR
jgi:hypothetical protein